MQKLSDILSSKDFTTKTEVCPGCQNHCVVKVYTFSGDRHFYSGNNCEKVYSNENKSQYKGVNLFQDKYRMLFSKNNIVLPPDAPSIGIPRGLGMYENFPFWNTLFSLCGFRVVLSNISTNRLYEKGIGSIMADNICFPAKLFHGHIMDLIERRPDRIFYPWVVYEKKEDKESGNSFNCPIVSGYSDVIRSSIDPEGKYGIPFDSPVISFKEENMLRESCTEYLRKLGVSEQVSHNAITIAIKAQEDYLQFLTCRSEEVLNKAQEAGRMVIMLSGRPYHIDPLIEHKIAECISEMGVDVITENVAREAGSDVYTQINALSQWAYPNRLFKAAYFCGKYDYDNLHMVELTSFGCGPDAFILDEVRLILNRFQKNLTVLKIDDVNNIGSLKLRVRSLVDSVAVQTKKKDNSAKEATQQWTTKSFEKSDRVRTILAPYFAEGYSEFLPTAFKMMGYDMEVLPMGSLPDAEEGLKDANNDICYPATIVVGSILRALKSGKYDLDKTAVAITQTGGQCRASNYYSLIKNALVKAGFADVPVISVAIGEGLRNTQPGFNIPWKRMLQPVVHSIYFADTLAKLYYPAVAREKEKGSAKEIYDKYLRLVQPLVFNRKFSEMRVLLAEAVKEFEACMDAGKEVPVVGVVGEIYVKYNSFSNKNTIQWLIDHNIEVVPPAISGFFSTSIVNASINRKNHIKEKNAPLWLMKGVNMWLNKVAHSYDDVCKDYPHYRPFVDIFHYAEAAKKVINPAADFGEGWFLPGEICYMAEHGINKVVSLQPFGCIANHIISKGIEKRFKTLYPNLSLLFLDFDAGTSEANVYNRLHFML